MRRMTVVALLVLASCGSDDDGGGGGPGVGSAAYCADVADWPADDAEFESAVVALVNEQRERGASCGGRAQPAVPPLSVAPELRCAARVHSLDMDERDYFEHTSPEGLEPWDRMTMAGYEWSTAGENIAGGQMTPEAAMESWMGSTRHCTNIMSSQFTEIGVGYVPGLWTQVFAAPL